MAAMIDEPRVRACSDVARVHEDGIRFDYEYDASKSAAAEIDPVLIIPDDNATLVAYTPDEFASTTVALQSLQRAQQEYERAALYLASHDTSSSEGFSVLLRTRLAALDEMAETSRKALGDAPADPIMNQVYLTTLGARNMTLSRLATALPVGSRLSRF